MHEMGVQSSCHQFFPREKTSRRSKRLYRSISLRRSLIPIALGGVFIYWELGEKSFSVDARTAHAEMQEIVSPSSFSLHLRGYSFTALRTTLSKAGVEASVSIVAYWTNYHYACQMQTCCSCLTCRRRLNRVLSCVGRLFQFPFSRQLQLFPNVCWRTDVDLPLVSLTARFPLLLFFCEPPSQFLIRSGVRDPFGVSVLVDCLGRRRSPAVVFGASVLTRRKYAAAYVASLGQWVTQSELDQGHCSFRV